MNNHSLACLLTFILKGGLFKMAGWASWAALVGGVVAVIGAFAWQNWAPLTGGIIAVIGALGTFAK